MKWKPLLTYGSVLIAGALLLTGCQSSSLSSSSGTTPSKGGQNRYLTYSPSLYKSSSKLSSEWLKNDAATKSVTVSLTLPSNGLSLNGYSHGFAEIEVPVGWKVAVDFQNNNPDVSGKLTVVKPSDVLLGSQVKPAITGASTVGGTAASTSNSNATTNTVSSGGSSLPTMQFTATPAGNYVMEFVPAAFSGGWLWFIVSPNVSQPEVKLRG